MCKEIKLDVHTLEPPAPFDIVVQRLTELDSGEYVKMMHRMQPFPLYDMLLDNGFRYKVFDGVFGFDIYIWLAKDKEVSAFLKNKSS